MSQLIILRRMAYLPHFSNTNRVKEKSSQFFFLENNLRILVCTLGDTTYQYIENLNNDMKKEQEMSKIERKKVKKAVIEKVGERKSRREIERERKRFCKFRV